MRNRKGRRYANNLRNVTPNNLNRQGYTYVGRCRCGYGPNAYYRDQKGTIIPANQLNQTSPPVQKINKPSSIPKQLVVPNALQNSNPPKMETYRICNKCGARVRNDAYFCTECGNALGDPSFLPKKDKINLLKQQIKDLKYQIKNLKKNSL
jgi:hypothetical protein